MNHRPTYTPYPPRAPYIPRESQPVRIPAGDGSGPHRPRPPKRKKRRLKKNVKRFFWITGALILLLIVRPWSWTWGSASTPWGRQGGSAAIDTQLGHKPLNQLLTNADSELPEAERFDRQVLQFMRKWELTGASLAIMKNGNLIYSKGYGWADREDREPMEVRHILRIASLSKLITATAVMKLWEQGRLRLNDQVFGPQGLLRDPRFSRYTDKRMELVTVEQLLRHRGGFSVRSGDPMFDWTIVQRVLQTPPPYHIDTYVEYATRSGLGYRPAARTYYSNLGYVVLAKVIEQVAGMPYERYVQDSILRPAGCYDMHIGQSRHEDKFPNEVRYYETKEAENVPACDGSARQVAKSNGGNDVQGLSGAGGWVASPTELLKFVAAIDGDPSRPDILKRSTVRKMTDEVKGELPIGWMKTNTDGTWSRTGTMAGTNALLRKQSNGYVWVFVTNTSSWKGSRFHGHISTMLRQAFDKVTEWPEKDMFEADSLMIGVGQ